MFQLSNDSSLLSSKTWLRLGFQECLASTNAANIITANVNQKRTVDQTVKKSHNF